MAGGSYLEQIMNKDYAVTAGASATLGRLRQAVAKIEGQETDLGVAARALAFGVPAIDASLQGGLAPASLHEIAPASARDLAAAAGFAFALAARAPDGRNTLWIQTDFAALEAGNIYGPGCDLFGLPASRLLIVKVARPLDALWAMEEALKCRALACVIAELPKDGAIADLTATRRLTLAAREGGGFGFLLRHRPSPLAEHGGNALGSRRRAESSGRLWRAGPHRLRPRIDQEQARPGGALDHRMGSS